MEKIVIIGSGPAGLTAALYTARANIQPLHIEGMQSGGLAGGQLMVAGMVENYPGFPKGLEGPELIQRMREQANTYNLRVISTDVISANLQIRPFAIACSNGESFETHAIIIAAGASVVRLPLESETHFWQKGISTCAVCDGGLPIYRNQALAVIGGGDTAVEYALHLARFGSKIYIIHRRSTFRASKIIQERVFKNPKIEILWNTTVSKFYGDEFLAGLRLRDEITGTERDLHARGAFEAIGHSPNTRFLNNQLSTDASGFIITQPGSTITSIPGVFAAGDIADNKYRQAVTAAGSGCQAAIDAERWLQENSLL